MEKMGSFSRGHKGKWYLLWKCYTTATGSVVKEAVTAILMHSLNGNSTIVGVSNGGTDFNVLNKEPQSFSITKTTMTSATATAGDLKRVVYADSNGQKVAGSDANKSKTHESFANPSSFKNATNGGTGLTVNTIDNENMVVTYQPTKT